MNTMQAKQLIYMVGLIADELRLIREKMDILTVGLSKVA